MYTDNVLVAIWDVCYLLASVGLAERLATRCRWEGLLQHNAARYTDSDVWTECTSVIKSLSDLYHHYRLRHCRLHHLYWRHYKWQQLHCCHSLFVIIIMIWYDTEYAFKNSQVISLVCLVESNRKLRKRNQNNDVRNLKIHYCYSTFWC